MRPRPLRGLTGPRDPSTTGPAPPAPAPRFGAVATLVSVGRLPTDLLVAVGYVVRELPYLVQDLRSAVNDVARLAHEGDPGALSELVGGLARAAGPTGALTRLLEDAAALAATRSEVEAQRVVEG